MLGGTAPQSTSVSVANDVDGWAGSPNMKAINIRWMSQWVPLWTPKVWRVVRVHPVAANGHHQHCKWGLPHPRNAIAFHTNERCAQLWYEISQMTSSSTSTSTNIMLSILRSLISKLRFLYLKFKYKSWIWSTFGEKQGNALKFAFIHLFQYKSKPKPIQTLGIKGYFGSHFHCYWYLDANLTIGKSVAS